MVAVPEFVFYAVAAAAVLVCGALIVLLVYLVLLARAALRLFEFIEEGGKRAGRFFGNVRRMFGIAHALFFD